MLDGDVAVVEAVDMDVALVLALGEVDMDVAVVPVAEVVHLAVAVSAALALHLAAVV